MPLVEIHSAKNTKESEEASLAKALPISTNPQVFEQLFRQYYQELCRYSICFVKQEEIAEEVVQDVFINIWKKNSLLKTQSALKAYLYTAVRNNSVNYLKSQFARQKFEEHDASKPQMQTNITQESLDYQELSLLIAEAVNLLPLQCKTIFEMSRSKGFTHEEIAREMQISPKTVENQIGIALKKLKKYLHQHWDILLVSLIILSKYNGYS